MLRALATFILAFIVLVIVAGVLGGFGIGSPELVIIVLLSLAATVGATWYDRRKTA